jgi:hypothetical protein
MKGIERVPVKQPGQSFRYVPGELLKLCAVAFQPMDAKFQGGLSRESHLGQQLQPMGWFRVQDPEEIQGISHTKICGVPASSPETDTPHHAIQKPSNGPQKIGKIPPIPVADLRDGVPHLLRRRRQDNTIS